jgi:hypothetical protein
MKDVSKTTELNITSGTPTTLTASWPSGTYSWSTGETTRSITVSPTATTTYTVKDMATGTCVTDVFNVTVGAAGRFGNTTDAATQKLYTLKVLPTMVKKGQPVQIQTNTTDATEAALVDVSGKFIKTYKFTGNTSIPTSQLQAGVYFIRLVGNKKSETQKIVVVE